MLVLVVNTVLVGEAVIRHSNTVASPAGLVLHYHYLNTSRAGLHEGTGVGAAIVPLDTKKLDAISPGFSDDIDVQPTPRSRRVAWSYKRLCRRSP